MPDVNMTPMTASAIPNLAAPRPAGRKAILASGLSLLILAFCQNQLEGAQNTNAFESRNVSPQVDPYVQQRNQAYAREQQELYRKRVSITDAMGDDVPAPQTDTQNAAAIQISPPAHTGVLYVAVLALAGILAARRFAPEIFEWRPRARKQAKAFSPKVRAEEEGFTEFITAFRGGPVSPATDSGTAPVADEDPATDPIKEFLNRVTVQMATQRRLVLEINRAADDTIRLKLLADLRCEISTLKTAAGLPALRTVWQIASAMEGLLKQLTDKPANIVPSTLRTVAGGVDLLNELCTADLKPDLLGTQPLKLLAVDDDLISRNALSNALKKMLTEPDLAANGQNALILAGKQKYDVIFVDVQSPRMDGFALCSKIHETMLNRTTPIVFVTVQGDFNARARSALSGGHDLMGKPFLTFEVTVKALTLGLRGRLRKHSVTNPADASRTVQEVPSSLQIRGLTEDEQHSPRLLAEGVFLTESHTTTGTNGQSDEPARELPQSSPRFLTPRPQAQSPAASPDLSPDDLAGLFWSRASTHLPPLRELFDAIFQTADEETRQKILAEIYVRVHSFAPKENLAAAAHPAMRLCSALEGFLRKLLEDPNHCTMSTLVTLASGLDLLQDLCASRLNPDLLSHPPIQLLVVDDDPVARRAITCALQMTFGKPGAAENGEAALALTAEKKFDVIFLDVQMPGMDGLTVCSQIREAGPNIATPVVFVTAQDDFGVRAQMSQSGGSDYIAKPFLNSEISIKALTLALRGRLQQLTTPGAVTSDAQAELV
jgi:CheY-like chemotaxis protein